MDTSSLYFGGYTISIVHGGPFKRGVILYPLMALYILTLSLSLSSGLIHLPLALVRRRLLNRIPPFQSPAAQFPLYVSRCVCAGRSLNLSLARL